LSTWLHPHPQFVRAWIWSKVCFSTSWNRLFSKNGAEAGGVRERALRSPTHPLAHRGAWRRRAGRGSSAPPLTSDLSIMPSLNKTIQIAHFLCIGRICTHFFACGANTPTEADVARKNQSMDISYIIATPVKVLVTSTPPMGGNKVPAVGLRYEMRSFVFVCKALSNMMRLWKHWRHWNEICLRFFTRSCGLRPPPASQRRGSRSRNYGPAPGQPAFAEPTTGQLFVLDSLFFSESFLLRDSSGYCTRGIAWGIAWGIATRICSLECL
jgi:hypothetical protein